VLQENQSRAEALATAGWTRRFIAEPARCDEARELYESLGLEVHLESLAPETPYPECADCQLAACMTYQVIYTRPRAVGS
jgi:hypothetical protein